MGGAVLGICIAFSNTLSMFVAFALMPMQRPVLAGGEITAAAAEPLLCLRAFFLMLVYNNSLNFPFPKTKIYEWDGFRPKKSIQKVLFIQSYDIYVIKYAFNQRYDS